MKKILVFLLLIGAFSLYSCNSDDDNNAEPVLGDWILTDVNPAVIDPNGCPNDTTVKINGDNTIQSSFYLPQNDCNLQQETGNWTFNGNSSYTMEFPQLGEVVGIVNFSNPDTFTFTTEGAVFTFVRLL